MRVTLRPFSAILLPLVLAGCVSTGTQTASLEPAPTSVTALNGGLIGQIGGDVPDVVQRQALEAEYQALQFGRVGQPVSWSAEGFRGEIVPTQLYRVGSQDCRGYTHVVSRGETTARQVGTACRDGNLWTIV